MERHRYKRIATTLSNKLDSWLNRFNHEEDEKISEEQENVPEIITEPNLNFYENPKNTALPYEKPSMSSTYILPNKSVTSKVAPLNLPKFESPSPILTHFSSTKTLKKSTKKSSTKVTKPKKLFEDSDFPPTQSSIGKTLSKNVAIEWLRPHEISQNPVFSSTNNTTGHLFEHLDVQQGDLGDCWFLAALGSLTAQPLFFERVVPLDQVCSGVDYDGKFEFNFFQYGEWAKVFVDDRLPTVNGNLIYTRSNDRNEFWVALLEKAYAKIHRCYENLLGGTAGEAMVDLTGGLLEYRVVFLKF